MTDDRELAAAIVFLQKLPARLDRLCADVASVGASMGSPSGTGIGAKVSRDRSALLADIGQHRATLERRYRETVHG